MQDTSIVHNWIDPGRVQNEIIAYILELVAFKILVVGVFSETDVSVRTCFLSKSGKT